MDEKVIFDCSTGQEIRVPLTPEEIAERENYTPPPQPVDRIAQLEQALIETQNAVNFLLGL